MFFLCTLCWFHDQNDTGNELYAVGLPQEQTGLTQNPRKTLIVSYGIGNAHLNEIFARAGRGLFGAVVVPLG